MFLITIADWVIAEVESLGAAAPPSVTELVHLVVFGRIPNLYQIFTVREKLNTELHCRNFAVIFAAMRPPSEKHRQSSVRKMLELLVE